MSEALIESTILKKFQVGEHRAFNAVFEHYYSRIKLFCFKLVIQNEDAEEIALQTFHKLFQLHNRFETQENIQAFLYISARNACIDYLRAQKRKLQKERALMNNVGEATTYDLPELQIEILYSVYKQIEKLPPACKQVFTLIYLNELSPKEVANQMNISIDNVYKQKKRALHLLRVGLLALSFTFFVITTFCTFVSIIYILGFS